METLDRTVEHRDRLRARQELLREKCALLLGSQSSFVWEIGCGHGHFLTAYAEAHRDKLCIGIDVILKRIERAGRKRERARLPNLHFVRAEARDFVAALPTTARLTEIFVLFPDPWPKRRHHKNRLMNALFLHSVALRAGKGARLHFRTDFEPYFLEVAALLAGNADWRVLPAAKWPLNLATVFQQKASRFFSLVAERL